MCWTETVRIFQVSLKTTRRSQSMTKATCEAWKHPWVTNAASRQGHEGRTGCRYFQTENVAMEANKDLLLSAKVISGTNGFFLQFVPSHIATSWTSPVLTITFSFSGSGSGSWREWDEAALSRLQSSTFSSIWGRVWGNSSSQPFWQSVAPMPPLDMNARLTHSGGPESSPLEGKDLLAKSSLVWSRGELKQKWGLC